MMIATPISGDIIQMHQNKETSSGIIEQLVSESRSGIPLLKSAALSRTELNEQGLSKALSYIVEHPDHTSYHLLFAVRKASPARYQKLDPAVKARILADSLRHVKYLNDWGYLDPAGSHDGEAALALLELGREALGPLQPLLDDPQAAPLYGSETATLSSSYKLRRQDFAYRYASLIMGQKPEFAPDPRKRDIMIQRLKSELKGNR